MGERERKERREREIARKHELASKKRYIVLEKGLAKDGWVNQDPGHCRNGHSNITNGWNNDGKCYLCQEQWIPGQKLAYYVNARYECGRCSTMSAPLEHTTGIHDPHTVSWKVGEDGVEGRKSFCKCGQEWIDCDFTRGGVTECTMCFNGAYKGRFTTFKRPVKILRHKAAPYQP